MTDLKRKWWASALCNDQFLLIETYSGYRSSMADPNGKAFHLPINWTDEAAGEALREALKHSRFVLPKDDMALYDYKLSAERYAAWVAQLIARYGYKSKRSLFKDMKSCSIVDDGDVISIAPSHHDKLEGWGRVKGDGLEDVVIPSDSTPENVGAALRLAFSRCTG